MKFCQKFFNICRYSHKYHRRYKYLCSVYSRLSAFDWKSLYIYSFIHLYYGIAQLFKCISTKIQILILINMKDVLENFTTRKKSLSYNPRIVTMSFNVSNIDLFISTVWDVSYLEHNMKSYSEKKKKLRLPLFDAVFF